MEFQSPGGAFTSAFSTSLMQDAAAQRQAMLDDLNRKKVENDIAQGQAALAEKKQEHADTLKEKERNQTVNDVANLVPGDVPDAELVARANKHHVPLRTTPDTGGTVPAQFGETATDTTGAVRFAGTPQQAATVAQQAKAKAFIDALPDADPRKAELKQAFEAEAAGLKVPPGYFAKAPVTHSRVIFDPISKKYFRDGKEIQASDIPADAQVDRSAEPRSTTGAEGTAANRLQQAREHAYTEFNNDAKPVEDTINRVNRTLTSLNANSNIADSTLAEMIVTMTAGGVGSGVRISQPMINQVLSKGRTHWADLDLALRRWEAADPAKKQDASLFFTDDQRAAIRSLAQAYRKEANRVHSKIVAARHEIDAADDIGTVNKVRTRAQEDIFAPVDGGTSDAAPTGGLPPGVTVVKRAK